MHFLRSPTGHNNILITILFESDTYDINVLNCNHSNYLNCLSDFFFLEEFEEGVVINF